MAADRLDDAVVRWRVPTTFELPALDGLDGVAAVVPVPPTTGERVVADSDALALARWGVGLSHDGSAWSLRLAPHPGDDRLPTVHRFPNRPATVPAAAVRAVRRLAGDDGVGRVARLVTRRDAVLLAGPGGDPLVQVAVEEVSVHTGRRLTGRFREAVVRPDPAAGPELVAAVGRRLTDGGALGVEDVDRGTRVLGPAASGPPDLPVAPDDGAGAVWGDRLREALRTLLLVDPHLRLDDDGRAAVAAIPAVDEALALARLVRAPAPVVDGLVALLDGLEAVHRASVRVAAAHEVPVLQQRAAADLRTALAAVRRTLDDEATDRTVDRFADLVADPVAGSDETVGPAVRTAALLGDLPDEPAATVDVARRLTALAVGARLVGGKSARRFAKAARTAATAVRAQVDAEDLQHWLRRSADELDPPTAFRAGRLAGLRADEAAAAADDVAAATARLRRSKATEWVPRPSPPDDGEPAAVDDPRPTGRAAVPPPPPSSTHAEPTPGAPS